MKFLISLFLFIISVNTFAQNIDVTVNPKVYSFINRVQQYGDAIHRSGLIEARDGLFDKVNPDSEFSKMTQELDQPGRHFLTTPGIVTENNEYRISYDDSRPLMENFLKLKFANSIDSFDYNEYSHDYTITLNNKSAIDNGKTFSIDDLKQKSDAYVRTKLPFLKNKIEYFTYKIQYSGENIELASFLYRRIFKGGIVKMEISKVEMILDASGTLQSIAIKWPTFKKANNTPSSTTVMIYEGLNAAIKEVINHHSIAQKFGGNDTMHATNAEITGMAFGWFPAEMADGSILLTPSYSYMANIKFHNNVELNPIIDIPILKKYWP